MQNGTNDGAVAAPWRDSTSADVRLLAAPSTTAHPRRMDIQQTLRFIRDNAAWLGRELTEKALTLVNALLDERTPAWARAVILGALAYLVMPLDACPDPVPVAGLADDLAALLGALASTAASIRPEHVRQARATAEAVFGK